MSASRRRGLTPGRRDATLRAVRPPITDKNIKLVYGTIFLLGLAYGLAISVVALFLDSRGFGKEDLGSLASWFALGIVAFSLPMGGFIRRFSARTTLIACLLGYIAAVVALPFLPTYTALAVVRFVDGACSVGIWVACETILLSRADKTHKAYVTSLYAVSIALGYIVGPLIAKGIVALAPMRTAFLVAGGIAFAAALVATRLDPDVRTDDDAHAERDADADADAGEEGGDEPAAGPTPSLTLLARIKTSCFATFAYGYFQASVVLFLPLYLRDEKGIAADRTLLIPAFFATGMLLASNPAGRLGDRFGHLLLMRGLGAVGTTMVLGFVFLDAYPAMCAAVFVAGATLASISPVSLALQGVITKPRDYSRANAIYNAFYAAGMLLGPFISSRIYAKSGGGPMLYHLAALWSAFVVFTVVYFRDDPAARRRGTAADSQAARAPST